MSEHVTPALVDITSLRPDAVQITGIELKVGDLVFDIQGGTHVLTSVRGPLSDGQISYKRADANYRERIGPADPITVVRPEPVKIRDGFSKHTDGVAWIIERLSMDNTVTPPRQIAWLCEQKDPRYNRSAYLDELRTMDGKPLRARNGKG
jgi:hypothetical protein